MQDERARRRYGLRWTPVTWQGWAVVGAFVVVLIAVPAERAGGAAEAPYPVVVVVAIAALVRDHPPEAADPAPVALGDIGG